jgi:hypothetical protein
MKTKLVKNIMAPLVVACVLLPMVVAAIEPSRGTEGGRLQGTWDVQVRIIDCQTGGVIATFASMLTFHAGRTLMEATSGLPPATKTPGEGVWEVAGPNTYNYRFKFFTFDAQGVFTGWRIANVEVIVDQTGNNYEGSGTQEIYDANGNLVGSGCVSPVGTRFEL